MAGTNGAVGFTADDLRMILGLCELDHRVTDLIGPRTELHESVQHRYRVSTLAAKANVLLQAHIAAKVQGIRDGDPVAPPEGSR
jgi:hypothetical protein